MTFLWLAYHNCLSDNSCPLCHLIPETTIHILRDYPVILPIWNDLTNDTLPPGFLMSNLLDWLKLMATSSSVTLSLPHIPWRTTFPLAAWIIWSTHNKLVMEGQPFISQLVIDKIKTTSQDIFYTLLAKTAHIKSNIIHIGWNNMMVLPKVNWAWLQLMV